jgi:hypothetical protein
MSPTNQIGQIIGHYRPSLPSSKQVRVEVYICILYIYIYIIYAPNCALRLAKFPGLSLPDMLTDLVFKDVSVGI